MFNNTSHEDKRKTKTNKKGSKLLKGIVVYYWFILMIKLFHPDLEAIIHLLLPNFNYFNFSLLTHNW